MIGSKARKLSKDILLIRRIRKPYFKINQPHRLKFLYANNRYYRKEYLMMQEILILGL